MSENRIRKEVRIAATQTWGAIASDWMQGFDASEGELAADDVAEAVFDADRITSFNPDLSPEALAYINLMSWPQKIELCKEVL